MPLPSLPPRQLLLLRRVIPPVTTTAAVADAIATTKALFFFSTSTSPFPSSPSSPTPLFSPFLSKSSTITFPFSGPEVEDTGAIVEEFRQWFRRPATTIDRIYEILATEPDELHVDTALSTLNLRLDEAFVLQVLRHQPRSSNSDVPNNAGYNGSNFLLLRLKFFDWAGRQQGFHHTRATYHAIFKLLWRAKRMSVIIDWLKTFSEARTHHGMHAWPQRIRFHETLVVGYAVAGRSSTALQVFARMRFQGIDLNDFSYHVLFNALVEESVFDVADFIRSQIEVHGHSNAVTAYIHIKSLCKQGKLDEARNALLHELKGKGAAGTAADRAVGVIVDTLCKMKRFEEANRLVQEFGGGCSYAVWLRNLIETCKVDGAIDFLQSKKTSVGYIPEVYTYNRLLSRLLLENRLEEVYDVLAGMKEDEIVPNRGTLNAALCFFCKAGMVDVALKLYNSRGEFGLTPNSLAFYQLINALCGSGSTDEACCVLEESMRQGYFPGKHIFRFLTELLCDEGKLDKMGKLLDAALKRNTVPISTACARYVSALCKAGRTEEGYMVAIQNGPGMSIPLSKHAYVSLINGFISLRRSDMVCRLLLEMQDNGHLPSQKLYRDAICCLCEMDRLNEVCTLLELQLSRSRPARTTCYNYFIDGLGHAKRPEFARQVFERMLLEGIEPNVDTQIHILQSYLKSHCISNALGFFRDLHRNHEPSKKLYNVLIVGLCKAGRPDLTLPIWNEVREKGLLPSLHCYEELVHAFCSRGDYHTVVSLLEDFQQTGRQVSSFLCNTLLSQSLRTPELWNAWSQLHALSEDIKQPRCAPLATLVAAFSGGIGIKQYIDYIEAVIEKYFPVNVFTYNTLMRSLITVGRLDYACDLFSRMCRRGFVPNKWSYDIIVHGFCKHGRKKDAEFWMEKMFQQGHHPTWYTMRLLSRTSLSEDK